MLKTVMFDLDGTLVQFDYDDFLKAYVGGICAKVSHVVDPKRFVKQLLSSTDVVVRSLDPARTNQEVFWKHFTDGIGMAQEDLLPDIDSFYRDDFPQLCGVLGVRPRPEARAMIEKLISDGYEVVIATNPVFPLTAIEERMRWGGVDGLPYRLVTSYETCHYCKPNTEYYREILDTIGRSPEECFMAGNDAYEDLAAGELGITTYLVEDFLLDRGPIRRTPTYQGRLSDLAKFFASEEFAAM